MCRQTALLSSYHIFSGKSRAIFGKKQKHQLVDKVVSVFIFECGRPQAAPTIRTPKILISKALRDFSRKIAKSRDSVPVSQVDSLRELLAEREIPFFVKSGQKGIHPNFFYRLKNTFPCGTLRKPPSNPQKVSLRPLC